METDIYTQKLNYEIELRARAEARARARKRIMQDVYCGKHECNIGGYMSMPELDSRPFYYCSKDTAKLCLRKGVTLRQYYSDLLAYFLDFERKYDTDFFEKEIKHVIKKLTRLEAYAAEVKKQDKQDRKRHDRQD